MSKRSNLPVALTIAGSDSGGGAGVQADLHTFAALGVHGTSAVTCITAQNPSEVCVVQPCRPEMVRRQIEAVFAELRPAAVKTGMLYSTPIVEVVVDVFRRGQGPALVVDPVMISTSGTALLNPSAIRAIQDHLLPLATLVTPNLHEAENLLGRGIRTVEELRAAARDIQARYGCAALVKGGHLRGVNEAVDFFYDGRTELLLSAPFVKNVHTHGTGCTCSAAVAGYLALGHDLPRAVERAKHFITQAIAQSRVAAGHSVLNWLWQR